MADPLLCEFPLPLRRRVYPLGFPVDLFTNSEPVIQAAEEAWAEFPQQFERPAFVLRLGVLNQGTENSMPAPPEFRASQHLLSIISDSANFATVDLRHGHSFAWLTEAIVRDSPALRYYFLEAMAYLMISPAHLAPVHAACVSWQGRGVLLTGESGAGKSSLAYACARAGWEYICDDASYLVHDGDPYTVTGNPFLFRLRNGGASLFPELRDRPVTFRPNGKATIELRTSALNGIASACKATVHRIFFLKRTADGPPTLAPYPKDEANRQFIAALSYGDDAARAAVRRSLARLAELDIYELRYSDAIDAAEFLKTAVGE